MKDSDYKQGARVTGEGFLFIKELDNQWFMEKPRLEGFNPVTSFDEMANLISEWVAYFD